MQKYLKLLDFRKTRYAWLFLAMLANVAWVISFLRVLEKSYLTNSGWASGSDVAMLLGVFLGGVFIAFIITLLAKDGRGPTYGIYGGLAGLVTVVILVFSSPLLAGLVGLTSLLGGFNGGTLAEGLRFSRQNKK